MDHLPLQTRTCLFTDIVGSTFLKGSLDLKTAKSIFVRSIEIFKECLPPKDVVFDDSALKREEAGRIVSDTGDGVFAVFVSALDAVETALKVQWRMSRETWPTSEPVTIRIGLDVGDTTTRPDAVHGIDQPFGTVTDSAARIMSLGAGGQILMTQGVSYLISNGLRRHPFHREGDDSLGDLRLQLESHGNYRFKGDQVAEGARPLEVFEVRPAALGKCSRPETSEKCWPCDDSGQAVTGWRPLPGLEVPGTHPDKWVLEQRIGVGGFGAAWLAHNRSNAKQKRVFKFCYDLARARSFRREKKLFDLLNLALEKDPNLRANIAAIERSSMEASPSGGGSDPLPPYWVQSQHYEHGNLLEWALSSYGTAEQQLTPDMNEEEQHALLCKALALIPEKVRLALWVELARTTHAVHQYGIIHRDLKPTNTFIRIDQDGNPHPVLADFGIGMIDDFARLEAAGFTRGGFLGTEFDNNSSRTGTRLYTPPEALRGEKPSSSWDIYALGVLLYQFVRGDASLPLTFSWDQHVKDSLLRTDINKAVIDDRWHTAEDFAGSVSSLEHRRQVVEIEELRMQTAAERRELDRERMRSVALEEANSKVKAALAEVEQHQATTAASLLEAQRARVEAEKRLQESLFHQRTAKKRGRWMTIFTLTATGLIIAVVTGVIPEWSSDRSWFCVTILQVVVLLWLGNKGDRRSA
ncbi:MAG: hypothetical protein NTY98_06055 [Verrucomicrobia bacterium]|nr:hypothetical protein [Verrucomicrobiota bacterium]